MTDDGDPPDCQWCAGTGEGQHEGTSCYDCKGTGQEIVIDRDDYDGPDKYFNGYEWVDT